MFFMIVTCNEIHGNITLWYLLGKNDLDEVEQTFSHENLPHAR